MDVTWFRFFFPHSEVGLDSRCQVRLWYKVRYHCDNLEIHLRTKNPKLHFLFLKINKELLLKWDVSHDDANSGPPYDAFLHRQ
jgi:hypothetical protein